MLNTLVLYKITAKYRLDPLNLSGKNVRMKSSVSNILPSYSIYRMPAVLSGG